MNAQRDREIIQLYQEQQLSMAEVGRRYGLTRERVRQILNANGIPRHDERWPACERCGAEMRERFPSGNKRWTARFCLSCRPFVAEERKQARRDAMVEQAREFARVHGRTPGGADFHPSLHNISRGRRAEALRCRAETPIPFSSEVQHYFGSIRGFLAAAGLQPGPIGGRARLIGEKRRAARA